MKRLWRWLNKQVDKADLAAGTWLNEGPLKRRIAGRAAARRYRLKQWLLVSGGRMVGGTAAERAEAAELYAEALADYERFSKPHPLPEFLRTPPAGPRLAEGTTERGDGDGDQRASGEPRI